MNHIFSRSLISLLTVALFFLSAPSCLADVLFVHDYKSTEYLMGSQEAELLAGYTGQAMFMDKKARYTGRVMEAFLGKDKEVRETTHFLLDKDQIREIDYYKGKVIIYPLARLSDTNWIKGKEKLDKDTADIIRERYRTVPPKLSVTIHPHPETIGGYVCRRVEADIRLETIDVKKNSSSVTLVKQKLWVSTKVPGYGEYNAFQKKLAKRLGLDALRVGNLSVLLGYWDGSLDSIRDSLKEVKGYPVKSLTTVEGLYTAGVGTASAKTNTMQLKEESVELKKVSAERLHKDRFTAPSEFGVTVVE